MAGNVHWSSNELNYITNSYNGHNIDELAVNLGRTEMAVLNKLKRIKLYQRFNHRAPKKYQPNRGVYLRKPRASDNRCAPITSTTLSIIAISHFEGFSIKRISSWLGLNPICTSKMIVSIKKSGLYDHFLSVLKINNLPLYLRAKERGERTKAAALN